MAATLTGSEKQIAWAMSIRRNVLDILTTEVERCKRMDDYSEIRERLGATVAKLEQKTDARWWIDHRLGLASSLIDRIIGE